jgi:hypothetical protein
MLRGGAVNGCSLTLHPPLPPLMLRGGAVTHDSRRQLSAIRSQKKLQTLTLSHYTITFVALYYTCYESVPLVLCCLIQTRVSQHIVYEVIM